MLYLLDANVLIDANRDYYSIDLSVDVHVRRVFARLGLVQAGDSTEAIAYRARAMHPKFPGIFDFPAWEVGRKWCRPTRLDSERCYIQDVCPSETANG